MATIGYWLALCLTLLALYFPTFRYLAYLIPFMALIVGLAENNIYKPQICNPFIALLIFGLVLSPLANQTGAKDLFFMLSGISAALVIKGRKVEESLLLGLFVLGMLLFAFLYGNGLSTGVVYSLAKSESTFEGNFGFLFGLLAIYGMLSKNRKLFAISIILAFLALKRIVVLAVFICWMIYIIPDRTRRLILNPYTMLAANLLVVAALVLYANHQFDQIIANLTDQSANQLGQGRQALYKTVALDIFNNPFAFVLYGAGPGMAYDALGKLYGVSGFSNLHSDLLKIFFEYGLLAFCAFIFLGYSMKDARIRIFFLFANILYATDNVLIYHFFLFFLMLFASSLEQDNVQAQGNRGAPYAV